MEALSNLREHQLRSVVTHVVYLKFDIASRASNKALPNDGKKNVFNVNSSLAEQFHSPEINSAHTNARVTERFPPVSFKMIFLVM